MDYILVSQVKGRQHNGNETKILVKICLYMLCDRMSSEDDYESIRVHCLMIMFVSFDPTLKLLIHNVTSCVSVFLTSDPPILILTLPSNHTYERSTCEHLFSLPLPHFSHSIPKVVFTHAETEEEIDWRRRHRNEERLTPP